MPTTKKPKNLDTLVGKKAFYKSDKFEFEVIILKIERSFGHDRFRVKPVSGKGEATVQKLTNFHD